MPANGSVDVNVSSAAVPDLLSTAGLLLLSVALGLLILLTVIGNLFVMGAILVEKHLKTAANALVFSLALADLMVACLVMPLGAVYEVTQEWTLGPALCELWTSCDVMCCTASILHLLAIALDRYWAVTELDYARKRSGRRLGGLMLVVWAGSLAVSCAPVVGWKDDNFLDRIHREKRCLVSQDVGYQVFATCATFYLPLVFILLLYWRIFQEARKRIRRRPGTNAAVLLVQETHSSTSTTTVLQTHTEDMKDPPSVNNNSNSTGSAEAPTATPGLTPQQQTANSSRLLLLAKREKTRETLEAKRERKAAKTLAIITGVFVVCWLPFFVTALVLAICPEDCLPPTSPLFSIFLWLGYANSLLNPIIYTIFSPDFRNAFRRILCGTQTTSRH